MKPGVESSETEFCITTVSNRIETVKWLYTAHQDCPRNINLMHILSPLGTKVPPEYSAGPSWLDYGVPRREPRLGTKHLL